MLKPQLVFVVIGERTRKIADSHVPRFDRERTIDHRQDVARSDAILPISRRLRPLLVRHHQRARRISDGGMAIRIDALIRVPATTSIMAYKKIGWPLPLRDIGRADAGTNQRVVADLVQRRKPEMAGVLAHFDRSTCLDETVLERIINHSYSSATGSGGTGAIS